ncbi:DUF6090 family protein [Flagellimonas sp. 2504JD4-2]
MIKFFRKIRQKLLIENRFSKYLVYAIGEIILVVIGILIALQINNWNEERKAYTLGNEYLSGIKNDLKKDFVLLDSVMHQNSQEISLLHSVTPVFTKDIYNTEKYKSFFVDNSSAITQQLFYRGLSFRPVRANYNSLIADGKSSLIKNRTLFESIQEIYDERHNRIESIYETLKPSENRLQWMYAFEKRNWKYEDLQGSVNDQIFLDLINFIEIKFFYNQHLFDLKEQMVDVIFQIDRELETND